MLSLAGGVVLEGGAIKGGAIIWGSMKRGAVKDPPLVGQQESCTHPNGVYSCFIAA